MSTSVTPPADAAVDEHACVRVWVALARAYEAIDGRLAEVLRALDGLDRNELDALLRLGDAGDGGLRLCELAAPSRLTQPSVSRLVARLERRGWVTRRDDPDDRRGTRVMLTVRGVDLVHRAVGAHAACLEEWLLGPLTPEEQQVLTAALERIALSDQDRPEVSP